MVILELIHANTVGFAPAVLLLVQTRPSGSKMVTLNNFAEHLSLVLVLLLQSICSINCRWYIICLPWL